MSEKLKPDIKIYLDEISERLYSGHASIMIGTGFSKNAVPNANDSKSFLNWNELADIFFKKLYDRKPDEKDRYLNPIKLAEEVQAAFGRPTLDKIILDSLPDLDYSPAKLHKDLVSLPWNNIFTTNYDTLLERAGEKSTQRYDIVINQKDLVYSKNPRIVKLHGSFPSEKPFIITEEDYRTYPDHFALYLNTVQQSLIENTLCLIGFSGDDPNFLHWIGWIRDNLGYEHSPKIYLIGIFDISSSKMKLLERKNITVIDLSDTAPQGKDKHRKALEIFIKYLNKKEDDEIKLDWPSDKTLRPPNYDKKNDLKKEMSEVANEWRKVREEYPGWVVCPYENRKRLWSYTEDWTYERHLQSEDTDERVLLFLYELVWRLEKCLVPLWDDLAKSVNRVIEGFLSFDKTKLENENEFAAIHEKWLYLNFSYLRYLREEGLDDKWRESLKLTKSRPDSLPELYKIKMLFEECYFCLYRQDIKGLLGLFMQLKGKNLSPFEKARLASMMAEFGLLKESKALLEESLNSIRSLQNLKPITSDYTYLSQESYILQILKILKDEGSFWSRSNSNDKNPITKYYESSTEKKNKYDKEKSEDQPQDNDKHSRDYISEFVNRWSTLKDYKCDPWGELEFFKLKLEDQPIPYEREVKIDGFDIGHYSTSYKLGENDPEPLRAFNFLRFIEDIAMPLRVSNMTYGQESVNGAILRLHQVAPNWALSMMLRAGDSKSLDKILDRETLYRMKQEKVNYLLTFYLDLLNEVEELVGMSDSWKTSNIGIRIAQLVPEILSRLILKTTLENREKVLEFLIKVYSFKAKSNYSGIGNLCKRLISSWPQKDYNKLVNTILVNFTCQQESNHIIQREFPDPFLSLNIKGIKDHNVMISIPDVVVKDLLADFSKAEGEFRHNLFIRLAILNDIRALNKNQEKIFSELLWSLTCEDGFPSVGGDIDKYWFSTLPYPNKIEIYKLFKVYLLKLIPPVQDGNNVSISLGNFAIYQEFIGAREFLGKEIEWNVDDAEKLLTIILDYFDKDRKHLEKKEKDPIGERKKEFQRRFMQVGKIISFAVVPFFSDKLFKKKKIKLENFIEVLSKNDVSVSSLAEEMFSNKITKNEKFLDIVKDEASEKSSDNCFRGIISITRIIEVSYRNDEYSNYRNLSEILVEMVYWRVFPHVIAALGNISYLINMVDKFELGQVLDRLIVGLNYLRYETESERSNQSRKFSDLLHAREQAAELAFSIYKKLKIEQKQVPQEIMKWKEVCSSNEEFVEVKNQWLN